MTPNKKVAYIPALLLALISVGFLIAGLILQNDLYIKESCLILGVLLAIVIVEERTPLRLPYFVICCIILFMFFAMILGKTLDFYNLIPLWDKYLHLASGVLMVPLAYSYYLKLIRSNGEKAPHPAMAFWFCLMFAVAAAGVWEIFEYSGDQLLGLSSQRGSLHDTMQDIICGSSGGLLCSLYLYWSVKKNARGFHRMLENEILPAGTPEEKE